MSSIGKLNLDHLAGQQEGDHGGGTEFRGKKDRRCDEVGAEGAAGVSSGAPSLPCPAGDASRSPRASAPMAAKAASSAPSS